MIETLQDLLTVDTDKSNATDNKKLLRTLKQLIKASDKKESSLDTKAETLPYEAVSVVGNQYITVKFDLESKEGIVSEIEEDSRDTAGKNYMAVYHANNKLKTIGREQK